MLYLCLGLVLFLGVHSVRIVADGWRTRMLQQLGEKTWKAAYALVSLAGFTLLVWGFAQTRLDPVVLWSPPVAMRHIAGLLTLIAFIFLVAAYVPRNHLKAKMGHPMILGVKVWALAHLLANGKLADVVLFGAFLVWAILDFRSCRQRDRAAGVSRGEGAMVATLITVVVGVVAWAAFAFWGHKMLIGLSPMGV